MKKIISIFSVLAMVVLIIACSKPEKPEFRTVKDLKVGKITMSEIEVTGVAVMYNPNNVSLNVDNIDLDVFVDEKQVGKIQQTNLTEVPAKSEFNLPLSIKFPPSKIANSLLDAASILTKSEYKVKYKGKVTVKVLGIGIDVPLEKEEIVVLNK